MPEQSLSSKWGKVPEGNSSWEQKGNIEWNKKMGAVPVDEMENYKFPKEAWNTSEMGGRIPYPASSFSGKASPSDLKKFVEPELHGLVQNLNDAGHETYMSNSRGLGAKGVYYVDFKTGKKMFMPLVEKVKGMIDYIKENPLKSLNAIGESSAKEAAKSLGRGGALAAVGFVLDKSIPRADDKTLVGRALNLGRDYIKEPIPNTIIKAFAKEIPASLRRLKH
jgi:hypothetical protein